MGRLIDADKLKAHYAWWGDENGTELSKANKEVFDTIVNLQPTVDAVELVRCKDCVFFDDTEPDFYNGCESYYCKLHRAYMRGAYFCSCGRREDE